MSNTGQLFRSVFDEQEQLELFLNIATELASRRHKDFDQYVSQEWIDSASQDEEILNAVLNSEDDPAEKAYQLAKKGQEVSLEEVLDMPLEGQGKKPKKSTKEKVNDFDGSRELSLKDVYGD